MPQQPLLQLCRTYSERFLQNPDQLAREVAKYLKTFKNTNTQASGLPDQDGWYIGTSVKARKRASKFAYRARLSKLEENTS